MIEIGIIKDTPAHKIIDIRDKSQVIKAKYAIGKDDILKHTLMAEHYIEISFELNRNVSFKRSDYIEWEGEKYTLRDDYQPEQINKRKYKYTLKFEAVEMFFQDMQYWYLGQGLKESELRMSGNPEYFLKYAVENANRYFKATEFNIGTIEPTEIKDITFDVNTNTFNALNQIADVYGAEWYMTGKTIHLVNKVSFGDEVDFETEVSVLSMKREEGDSTTRYTRILALGSTRNIPYNYRESTPDEAVDAVYPKRLRIPVTKGDVIDAYPNMSPDEVVEGTVIFDEVYPRREGTIEVVGTIEYKDTNADTGEITKWNAYKIKDSGIVFKKEYLLPGQELKLQFISGDLNGRDFALIFHEKGFSSTDNSQYFEIVRTDEFGKLLPNDVMKPKAGDKYVLYGFNIALVSDQYVPAGEQELFDTASAWLQKQLMDTDVYECPTAIGYFQNHQMDLAIGQNVRLIKDVGSNRNLLRNTNFAKDAEYWMKTGAYKPYPTPYAKPAESNNNSLYIETSETGSVLNNLLTQPTKRLEVGKTYTISFWAAIHMQEATLHFEVWGGIGAKNFQVPAGWTFIVHTFTVTEANPDQSLFFWIDKVGAFYLNSLQLEEGNKSSKWFLSPEDVKDGTRSSRIMGFEKKLNNKFDAIYTVGDNSTYSRIGKIEQQIKELQVAGVVYENTGGSGVYLIKQFDNTSPTDFNAYSAKASDAKYFNKQTGGGIQGDTLFQKNMQVQGVAISDVFQNSTYTAGQFGSGFQVKRDTNGQSYMEVDNLLVRREALFTTITIGELKSLNMGVIISLADMTVSQVEDKGNTWRCYFRTDGGKIRNKFVAGDQAICRKEDGNNIRYYWTLVTAVGADYIELSKDDKDGSVSPAINDVIIQLGNRTDVNRQNAIILSAYGSDAPSIKQYAGINSYDLTGKEITVISPTGNRFTGEFIVSTNGTTAPVYKEVGKFENGRVYYKNDRVTHLGSFWVCIADNTIQMPNENSSVWRKETAGITDINKAIEVVETEFNSNLNVLNDKISSKVEQSDFNALGDRVSHSESRIEQQSDKIQSTIEKVDRLKNLQAEISTKSRTYYQDNEPSVPDGGHSIGDIWLKKSLVDYDGNINADVERNIYQLQYRWNGSTWERINWYATRSAVKQTERGIQLLTEKTGINSLGSGETLKSLIDQTPDKISLAVKNIHIGGENMFLNSSFNDLKGWNAESVSDWSISGASPFNTSCKVISWTGAGWYQRLNAYTWDDTADVFREGVTYTVSFYGRADGELFMNFGAENLSTTRITLTNDWQLFSHTFIGDGKSTTIVFYGSGNWEVRKYMTMPMLVIGNKSVDWSPSSKDTKTEAITEIASSFDIDKNEIRLASKKIVLSGDTIAEAIEAKELKIGDRNTSPSALEVSRTGKFYSKGSDGDSALIIDSDARQILLESMIAAPGENEHDPHVRMIKQVMKMDAKTGTFEVRNQAGDVSKLTSEGIFSNVAGLNPFPAGYIMRASVTGLASADLEKGALPDTTLGVVGVYGRASNTSKNPAPTYGGYFEMLNANGLCLNTRRITSDAILTYSDVIVACYNKSDCSVTLPASPYNGRIIYVRMVNSYSVTVKTLSDDILVRNKLQDSIVIGKDAGEGAMFIWDGLHWLYNYIQR